MEKNNFNYKEGSGNRISSLYNKARTNKFNINEEKLDSFFPSKNREIYLPIIQKDFKIPSAKITNNKNHNSINENKEIPFDEKYDINKNDLMMNKINDIYKFKPPTENSIYFQNKLKNKVPSISKIKLTAKAENYKKKFIKKFNKEFLIDPVLKYIQFFLNFPDLKNFILTCKKFNNSVIGNDELWFQYYTKKFNTNKTKYSDKQGRWRNIFYEAIKKIFKNNYESLKLKYLKQLKYANKKDPYSISNNLYNHLKPIFKLEIDGQIFKVQHVFKKNKVLSHINLYSNFDEEFIDLNKIKNINVLFSEKNLGIFNRQLISYSIKKISLKELKESTSKICKIYISDELTISTFEKNFIFFLNISMPICKICEKAFDFLNGIHGLNLNYYDDSDSKFGLYDYSLMVNLKSWNNLYYNVCVNTVDLKEDHNDSIFYYYEYTGLSKFYL
jgi:hypothetical protein